MIYDKAHELAMQWQSRLSHYCTRVEIAGSVRRQKQDVHDIELVATPQIHTGNDLFGDPAPAMNLVNQVILAWKRVGMFQLEKNGNRFKQLALPEGITIDLFLVLPPAQFGVIYAIRTGPREFSQWLVTQRERGGALPNDCYCREGTVYRGGTRYYNAKKRLWSWRGGEPVEMPEEEDYFRLCGLRGGEPDQRKPQWRQRAANRD